MVRLAPLSAADLDKLANGASTFRGLVIAKGSLSAPEVLAVLRDVSSAAVQVAPIAWLVIEDEAVVGMISFTRFVSCEGNVSQDDRRDFGYLIAPGHRGRGIATRAIAAFVEIARDRGLKVLTAETDRSNPASQRVLTKNGFTASSAPADSVGQEVILWSLDL